MSLDRQRAALDAHTEQPQRRCRPRRPQASATVQGPTYVRGIAARGAIFTRADVVEAILDLVDYTPQRPLHQHRLLEPAFGEGAFLLAAVARLIKVYLGRGGRWGDAADELVGAIRGVELHQPSFARTKAEVTALLTALGAPPTVANQLSRRWLIHGDFLLTDFADSFDFVVGNPPYVRQERIPAPLLAAYRQRYATLYDRADLYVPFYERGLDLLSERGALGFICANRWLKNKYGGPLRHKIARGFYLQYFIDLERADAFDASVISYPAITVLRRAPARLSHIALDSRGDVGGLSEVVCALKASATRHEPRERASDTIPVTAVADVASGSDPWLLDAPEVLGILRAIERSYPTLEATGAKVGIGVATGADRVFIGRYDELPVEPERKLKLAMAADCVGGGVYWSGRGIINPYTLSGSLAPLANFPRFQRYLQRHRGVLERRHTARQQPAKWYKTIDRIYPQLTNQPKLLIPDIKGEATVAYDDGQVYPHHNLYVVTAERWNLRCLQAILRSSLALAFVAAYGVRMAGGFLRFQAQYLRRIRLPAPDALSRAQLDGLAEIATSDDQAAIDAQVLPLYRLSAQEAAAVRGFAASARIVRKRPERTARSGPAR
ncbi:MAG: Eco57I restriction-modification methylase domain-containing protein [Haliangiales bacterium]